MNKIKDIKTLKTVEERLRSEREQVETLVSICGGTGCQASKAQGVIDCLQEELGTRNLTGSVHVRVTGCHGFCEQGPIVVIEPGNILYCHVKPDDIKEIVEETILKNKPVERLLYKDPLSGKCAENEKDITFYKLQDRTILSKSREVDPKSIDDYVASGGYASLAKVLSECDPEAVIDEIKASGLRGRGGGGYPTGKKWAACRAAAGGEKYVICNADEGDPGAYMDRSILEGNPHLILEGMLIGAYAIGAQKGYIYVRREYPLALMNAQRALVQARGAGLLGGSILGSDFSFDVEIVRGGGAFVCGESTALIASVEGKVGEPRPKDIHTVVDGLWHKPTTLNNVETWANVPLIVENGAMWFSSKGTSNSKGTKIFALTGRVKNTGLVEVAMGTSLKTILYDIGGGASNGTKIKAVQTGGPSGGCLPAEKFDLPVDFDTLDKAGSMVGSGGMVVMDEKTCMVDVAKYFLTFLQDESCGKCVPCRLGIGRMLEIVTEITEGRGKPEHLDLLDELGETIQLGSLCALGKTAPNPLLSTLKYFRDEYEAHIQDKRCPAGICRHLIEYSIVAEKCTGCGACRRACPQEAISGENKKRHVIDAQTCDKCGICASTCNFDAISSK